MTGMLAFLCGAAAKAVRLVDSFPSAFGIHPTPATATYAINSNGTATGTGEDATTWLVQGSASSFYVRADVGSPGTELEFAL